jgi:pimeloyl-ACP methyl ester carboxylesterase
MSGNYHDRGNGRIHYLDRGSGETIVLLHGYLENSVVWGGFASRLAEGYRVIAVDLPGHGGSASRGEEQTMDILAEAVHELLQEAGAGRVFMVGHSMGGYVALTFARLFPEMLSGFCLFHSHPFPDSREVMDKRNKEIAMVMEGKKELFYPASVTRMFADKNLITFADEVGRSLKIASSIPGDTVISVLRGMMSRPSGVELIERSLVPFLWILGAKDNYINSEEAVAKVRLPRRARLVILQNSGHMGFVEEQELSVKIITDFIRELNPC